MSDTAPGETYETGLRVNGGQHCGRCGSPDSTRQEYQHGMAIVTVSACCGFPVCFGYVCNRVWVGKRTGRTVWACHLGLAEQWLGEPAWMPLATDPTPAPVVPQY